MSFQTFKNAVTFEPDYVTIGGGEPTIHPEFDKFLMHSLTYSESIWMATNGKKTSKALLLSAMRSIDKFDCVLSIDDFHDAIDDEVYDSFADVPSKYNESGFEGIRTNTRITEQGSALENGVYTMNGGCSCESLFCLPNGDVKQCGCSDSPILGNINDSHFDNYGEGECYHT